MRVNKQSVKQKILVVDDVAVIASSSATILEAQGYETAIAYSGEEAVQVAHSFQPDFLLSDVMMGGMNGIQAAIEILRVLPKCKVLFISGNAGIGDFLVNARAKGFNFEILVKPVPPPELLTKIKQILSSPACQSPPTTLDTSTASNIGSTLAACLKTVSRIRNLTFGITRQSRRCSEQHSRFVRGGAISNFSGATF